MSGPRIGELFAGYGGLGQGVQAVLGGDIAWFSEFDKAPSKILAHHWPNVPNHGDITKIDWSTVEPVDILTGGFPCQDVSLAGARAGFTATSRSGLWSEFARAIDALKPRMVLIENVRGLLSASAAGSVEPDPWGMGDGATRPVINALGAVLGDLAGLGYDADWCGVRAADAGAPHGRYRVFIVAYRAGFGWGKGWTESAGGEGRSANGREFAADPSCERGHESDHVAGISREITDRATVANEHRTRPGCAEWGVHSPSEDEGAMNANSPEMRSGEALRELRSADGTEEVQRKARGSNTVPQSGELLPDMRELEGGSAGRIKPVEGAPIQGVEVCGMRNHEGASRSPQRQERSEQRSVESNDVVCEPSPETSLAGGPTTAARGHQEWGVYAPAIARWEAVMGRVSPPPTLPDGKNGSHRLSARFVEFLMGLDAGHVTDPAIGLTRNEQLKALGNGVVPQQAEMALRVLLSRMTRPTMKGAA